MPSLKDLRVRIKSVKATQKITSAMKMVAAAKLRRAQERVVQARPYARELSNMLGNCLTDHTQIETLPLLYRGNPENSHHLLVVATSDKGLCGGFNSSIVREARQQIRQLEAAGHKVRILCLGRKGREQLNRDYGAYIVDTVTELAKSGPSFGVAQEIAQRLELLMENTSFGSISAVYSVFKSVINQEVTTKNLVPFSLDEQSVCRSNTPSSSSVKNSVADVQKSPVKIYEFEPTQEILLNELLPRNLAVQIYQILLETTASEFGARMTAMDNASRNARDVIKNLELNYNRTRQAYITRELIEIISGAEAL